MNAETEVAIPETFVPTVSKTRLPSIPAPTNWTDLMAFCADLAKSGLVPKDFRERPADLAIAISMGNEVGLHWTHAIQSMAVINGRPSLWGDGALAVVMAHPDFEWIDENESTETCGVTVIKRRGMPERRYEFTLEMARAAGLLAKDTYKAHQGRMLQRRSRARCMADTFSDALKGIGLADDAPPEKLIGGSTVADEAPKSGAKAVQDKLAARKSDPKPAPADAAVIDGTTGEILAPEAIIKRLTEAKTSDELKTAADLAKSIEDATKRGEAQAAYRASLKRIRETAQ